MDAVIRGAIVYLVLLLLFRISGKRSLAQTTTFDFVLLLIISEAIQQALLANDSSITNSVLVVITLIGLDILVSLLVRQFPRLGPLFEGTPLLLIENGKLKKDRLDKSRVSEADILSQARKLRGLERMDQIKYAILEQNGEITIVPKEPTN